MSDATPHHDTGYGRQVFIVLLLTGGVILLHRFAVPTHVDPTAMLALGFLILASYTIGELVGAIRVPHITGYLAAGLLFGPSVATYLGQVLPFPPFEHGILSHDVIDSLRVFDTLAVALIALTAGGELKIAGLKKGFRVILGILSGQLALLFVLVGGVIWLLSGPLPFFVVPELAAVGSAGALGLGLVVASISVATSPAATIAVINSTGAKGPMTRAVLSTVVLKDVIVVVAFSIASALAAAMIGISSEGQDLGSFLAVHIGGSIVVGVAVGFLLSLYLRFVGRETLLVIVGVVYGATLLATALHLDPVLLFMAAGFTASNFSRAGDALIHNVERLSMPVYVIFFTLAGAGLHLEAIAVVGPVAALIVLARLGALYLGVGLGARLSKADEGTRRFGWLGFASQAGVAITLAAKVGKDFGEVGHYLETVIITGVAINELIGPILLKVGLGMSKEIPKGGAEERPLEDDGARDDEEAAPDDEEDTEKDHLSEWPTREAARIGGAWPHAEIAEGELQKVAETIRESLKKVVQGAVRGPLANQQRQMETYMRDLRREFLRHHRRLTVEVRSDESVIPSFHRQEAELAERWRALVLERAAEVRSRFLDLSKVVAALDEISDRAPPRVRAPYEEASFAKRDDEGATRKLSRTLLKTRRALGGGTPEREVEVRALTRYHFAALSARLESVVTLLVHGDAHLAARSMSLFDHIHRGYAALNVDDGHPIEERLRALKAAIDDELTLSIEEAERITTDAATRLDDIAGDAFAAFVEDLKVYGTPDLPASHRRAAEAFEQRMAAEKALVTRVDRVLAVVAATYSRLGLRLELIGLESLMKEMLDQEVRSLEGDVRGRTHTQTERLAAALSEAREKLEQALESTDVSAELSERIRDTIEPLEKVSAAAGAKAQALRDQLREETSITPLLEGLRRAALGIGESYTAPTGALGPPRMELPTGVGVVVVPFRELVSAQVEAEVAPALFGAARAMAATVEPLVSSLAEVERLLAFNVEVAGTELDMVGESVSPETRELLSQILFGAMERAQEIVEARRAESGDWAPLFGGELRQAVLGGLRELENQLTREDLSNERIVALRRRAAGQRLSQKAEAIPSMLALAEAVAKRTIRGVLGTARLEAWRRTLGLPRSARDTSPAAFIRPEPQTEIPLVYRRLFAARTVESADVLTGREQTIESARRILRGKTPGQMRSVALVGPDGVGKGALARAVVRTRAFKHVRHLSLDKPATVEDVDAWFSEGTTGQLFVVANFRYLLAMRAGGFAPLMRFIEGVVADRGRNAWLIHVDELVWSVATQAAPVAEAFPDVIEVPALGLRDLEAAVLARHGLSGYGLSFEHRAEGAGLDDLVVRAAAKIRRPYETYFRALHDASGGLVRDALALWLSSIDEVNDRADYVHVGNLPTSVEPSLDALPEEVLLNLLQVARQGWMDADVQAHVYRVEHVAAEAQLARLTNMGLLERESGGAYAIPVHLRGPVGRVLRARGWVR